MEGQIDFHKTPDAKSTEDVFRPAVKEIQRREQAAKDLNPNGMQNFHFDPSSPFVTDLPDQRYALLSVGTRVLAPCPVDGQFPSLRVYGCFHDKEEAKEHAEVVRAMDERCSLVVLKCNEWFLFPQDEEVLNDRLKAKERLEEKMRAHEERIEEQNQAFEDALHKNKSRKVNWDTSEWSQDQEEEVDAENEVYRRPRRLRAGAEVRGQNVCAFCTVPDPTVAGEVLLKILGCFENMTDAENWVQNVGSRRVVTHDIFIASTCEWLYPNGTREKTATDKYRIGELQKIMDAARMNPHNVRNYKEWKAEQDRLKIVEHERLRRKKASEEEGDGEEQVIAEDEAVLADERGSMVDIDLSRLPREE